MGNQKLGFEDFITAVDSGSIAFVNELHRDFIEYGCKIEVKEAKSGYVVSYTYNKKTIANYVFRKSGLMIRIYANHINQYIDFLNTLPDEMVKKIKTAPICKRLVSPDDCNSKCAMGYDFMLNGEHYQKCRNNAFMFLVCEDNNTFIKTFLKNELQACVS